jgi:hypothetical protein
MEEIDPRILQRQLDVVKEQVRSIREERAVETGGGPPHPPSMDNGWRSSVDNRLGELKGAVDGLRLSFSILIGAVGIVVTIGIGISVFHFNRLDDRIGRLDGRIDQLANKVEAIPQRLSDEFRAMRAEMSAQTSAIANAITATHQAPPPAPQIIVLPTPQQNPSPAPTLQAPKP